MNIYNIYWGVMRLYISFKVPTLNHQFGVFKLEELGYFKLEKQLRGFRLVSFKPTFQAVNLDINNI